MIVDRVYAFFVFSTQLPFFWIPFDLTVCKFVYMEIVDVMG
jgi:hypothetical protein